MERSVHFKPAWHRCTDPDGNYGIGTVSVSFILSDGETGVSWWVGTNMGLPDDAFADPECSHPRHQDGHPYGLGPVPGPVTWHSAEPFEDFDAPYDGDAQCRVTGGGCYSTSGYLIGDRAYHALAVEGEEALWAFLEEAWEDEFGGAS